MHVDFWLPLISFFFMRLQSLMSSPSKGYCDLIECLGSFDHQYSSVFSIFLTLPLFVLFAWSSSCLITTMFLEYLYMQSLMTSNYHPENILYFVTQHSVTPSSHIYTNNWPARVNMRWEATMILLDLISHVKEVEPMKTHHTNINYQLHDL